MTSIFHFTNSFNALLLNDTELALFSAIVLLSADRPGVTDVKAVQGHQDKLIEALKLQVSNFLLSTTYNCETGLAQIFINSVK